MNYTQEELDYWCYYLITRSDILFSNSMDILTYDSIKVLTATRHLHHQAIRIIKQDNKSSHTFSRRKNSSRGIPDFPLNLYGVGLDINENVRVMLSMHQL